MLAALYYELARPTAYLIIDVCGYVLLEGSHGVLHPQVSVRPQECLVGGTVAQEQEHPACKTKQKQKGWGYEECSECNINCS